MAFINRIQSAVQLKNRSGQAPKSGELSRIIFFFSARWLLLFGPSLMKLLPCLFFLSHTKMPARLQHQRQEARHQTPRENNPRHDAWAKSAGPTDSTTAQNGPLQLPSGSLLVDGRYVRNMTVNHTYKRKKIIPLTRIFLSLT